MVAKLFGLFRPAVAVFGASDAAAWAPRGERVRVVDGSGREGGLRGVSVEEIRTALEDAAGGA